VRRVTTSSLVIAGVGVAVLAATLSAGAIFLSGTDPADFWLAVADASLQLVVVGIFGALIAQWFKTAAAERDARERRVDYVRRLFERISESYADAKAVRRRLRGLGVRRAALELDDYTADAFNREMAALVEVQLVFERFKGELEVRGEMFPDEVLRDVLCNLGAIERYLNRLTDEWEANGLQIRRGGDVGVIRTMRPLQEFLRSPGRGSFNRLRDPLKAVLKACSDQLEASDPGRRRTRAAPSPASAGRGC
jgi:hypothetical protein